MANISFFEGLPTYDWQVLLQTVVGVGEFNNTTGAPLTELRLIAGNVELVLTGTGLAADGVRHMTGGTITSISLVSSAPVPGTTVFTESNFDNPPGFALFQTMLLSALPPGPGPVLPDGPAIDLTSLDGSNGFVFHGAGPGDYAGSAVAGAGDINGDGFADFIIGAQGPDNYSGAAYLVFGDDTGLPPSVDPGDLDGTNGFRIPGLAAGDIAGSAVGSAGDINGDGFDDLVVGASGAGEAPSNDQGNVYIIFGKASGWTQDFDLATLNGANGFKLVGGAADFVGGIAAGDVNGDTISDLIVTGQGGNDYDGSTYVVFGKNTGLGGNFDASIDLAALDGTDGFKIPGLAPYDFAGGAISVGDINGDGKDDIVIGADGANYSTGDTYVVFGTNAGFGNSFDLGGLNGANGFIVRGEYQSDRSGLSIASGGDFNGDGFDDLVIGAPYADRNGYGYYGTNVGRVYVVFGKENGFDPVIELGSLNGTDGFWITGTEDYDLLGKSVASAGDFNGDGFDDILVAAASQSSGHVVTTYLIFGSQSGFGGQFDLSDIDGVNGLRIEGLDGENRPSVAGIGDFNDDGFDDISVGSRGMGADTGVGYVIFGAAQTLNSDLRAVFFAEPLNIVGSGDPEELLGGTGDDNIQGVGGDDTIYGGGGYDDLFGGDDDDTLYGGDGDGANLDGGNGDDTLYGGDNDGSEFFGGHGSDVMVGGNGYDDLRYQQNDSVRGVIVNLSGSPQSGIAAGQARDNYDGIDTISGMDRVHGTGLGDQFFSGDDGYVTFVGYEGNDTFTYAGTAPVEFVGGDGSDTFNLGGADGGERLLHYSYEPGLQGYDPEDFEPGANNVWGDAPGEHGVIVNLSDAAVNVGITHFGPTLVAAHSAIDTYGQTDTIIAATGGVVQVTGTDAQDYIRGHDSQDVGDRLEGNGGDDTLIGGDGHDELFGGQGADSIFGGNDNDFINGGKGADTLGGGDDGGDRDFDVLSFFDDDGDSPITQGVSVNAEAGTVVDAWGFNDTISGFEQFQGTDFADTFVGSNTRFDGFAGGAGSDSFDGGGGHDGVDYGADQYIGDASDSQGVVVNLSGAPTPQTDEILEALLADRGIIRDLADYTLANGTARDGFADIDTLISIEEVHGNRFDDIMSIAGDGARLVGHEGDDILVSFGGDDTRLIGGDGDDIILGGDGEDEINGGAGNDTLIGGGASDFSADFFIGGRGADTIFGGDVAHTNESNRVLYDGETEWGDQDSGTHGVIVNLSSSQFYTDGIFGIPPTIVFAGTAIDSYGDVDTLINMQNVNGTQYQDLIVGGAEENAFDGRDGNDRLEGGGGEDELYGGMGIDTLYGGDDWDELYGDSDNDSLYGGDSDGANLFGGDGDDTLYGGDSGSEYYGGRGDDTIFGSIGQDDVRYHLDDAERGVIVNLSADEQAGIEAGHVLDNYNTTIDYAGIDELFGVDKVDGTKFADQFFSGDDGYVTMVGWEGDDTFTYAGTADVEFVGGEGADTFDLGGAAGGGTLHYSYEPGLRETFDSEIDVWGQGAWAGEHGVIVNLSNSDVVVGITNFAPTTVLHHTAIDTYGDTDTIIVATGGFVQVTGTDAQDYIRGHDNANVSERFEGNGGDDTLIGGAGNEQLIGGDGDDTLDGGDDGDWFDPGKGDDTITGGNGGGNWDAVGYSQYNDGSEITTGITVVVGAVTTTITDPWGGTDTVSGVEQYQGTDVSDDFTGGDGNDNFLGKGGADDIVAGGGDDGLIGGAGADNLDGGGGDHDEVVYRGEQFDDHGLDPIEGVIVNLSTTDNLTTGIDIGFGLTNVLAGHAKDTFGDDDTLSNIENVIGTDQVDYIVGGDGENFMNGYAGADTLIGGSASDTFADFFVGGRGNDTINGGANANEFNRVLYEGETDWGDQDSGLHGVIVNLSGTELVGVSIDGIEPTNVAAGTARDSYADNVDDEIDATDTLINIQNVNGTRYQDLIVGGAEDNDFDGLDDDDRLEGRGGADELRGSGGNDTIDGGAGLNTATYGVTLSYTNVPAEQDIQWDETESHWVVTAGAEGTDFLTNISIVEHAGGRFLLIGDGGYASFADAFADATREGDTIVFAEAPTSIILDAPGDNGNHDIVIPYDVPTNITVGNGNNNITTGLGDDVIITGDGDNVIKTGGGNDIVTTGIGNNVIIAGSGNGDDVYDFAAGDNDTVEYPSAVNGIVVHLTAADRGGHITLGGSTIGDMLAAYVDELNNPIYPPNHPVGYAEGLDIDTDVLIEVENVDGSPGNDLFVPSVVDDVDNVFDGAGGIDEIDYSESTEDITITMTDTSTHTVTGTGLGTDTVISFETFLTGDGDDSFTTTSAEFVALTEIDLGDGGDTLTVQIDGPFDFSTGSLPILTGIETKKLEGGANNDTVTLSQSQFGEFTSINLGGDTTGDSLTIKTDATFTYSGTTVTNVEAVTLDDNEASNTLTGSDGAETIKGNGGNDTIDGGAGANDTAVYNGAWVNYMITSGAGFTISDNRNLAPDGSDTVTDVEQFAFSNGTFDTSEISNDAPTDIALSGTLVLAEGASTGTVVGGLTATDADAPLGDTTSFSIVNPDGAFAISGTDLVVLDGTLLDFETDPLHSVTVRVTDAKGEFFDKEFEITLTDVNEAPTAVSFTGTATSLAENTSTATRIKVADIVVTDDALGSETLSLTGTDAASFEIDGSELFLKAGVVLDFETQNSYAVTVNADDGTVGGNPDASQGFVLSVTDVNEAPTAVSFTGTTTSLAENTSTASHIKVADIVVTDDVLGSETLSLAGTDAASFEIDGSELFLKAGVALDFETQNSYAVTVNADDGTVGGNPDASQGFVLSVTDVNEAPTAVSFTGTTTSLAENTSTATHIKVADIVVTDDALGSETLSLTGTDAASFEIVGSELFLKAGEVLNFEAKSSYAVTVNADDAGVGGDPDASQGFTLSVTDVNEAPTAVSFTGTTTSLAENTSTATHIKVADIVVTDDALGSETLSLTGANAASFEIVGSELFLKAGVVLDFETQTSYAVTVDANDPTVGGSPDATRGFLLSVTDANDNAPVITINAAQSVAENTTVVAALTSTDADGVGTNPASFSIVGGADQALFNITGGNLVFASARDFETQTHSYAVTVRASDGANDTDKAITVTLTDANDNAPVITTNAAHSVAENATVVAALTSTDADGVGTNPASFSIVGGADQALFNISGGNLVFTGARDFETQGHSYAVTVRASDGANNTDKAITVTLTDANDVAPAFSSGTSGSVAENAAVTTVVYDANATDGDSSPANKIITYSLTGADAARFSINATTGEVRFVASPDFEAPADGGANNAYDIEVRASDGVHITNLGVSISVTDQFEGQPTPGNDTISGTGANETFNGGLGNDILTGKGGADLFVFDSKLNKKSNVDHITDFTVGIDTIQLDRSIFKSLKPGDLNAKVFTAGKVQKDDRILYDKESGVLSFDKDGKGGSKAISFAVLDGSPDNLSATDFVVVA